MELNYKDSLSAVLANNRSEHIGMDVWDEFVLPYFYKKIDFNSSLPLRIEGGRGSGKTMLLRYLSYHSRFSEKRKNIPIISNDRTRRLLDSIGLDSTNQEVVHKLACLQMEYLINHHSNMIIDANAIRQHNVISKKAKELNVKCYYVNLLCDHDVILERLDYRENKLGQIDNYSRATKKDYLNYQEEIKNIIFPAEKIFFEIKTDEDLDKQVEKLFEKIERDI